MPAIKPQPLEQLTQAVRNHDFLRAVIQEIANLQRIVFHSNEGVDVNLAAESAEQILIAELHTRHKGEIDGIYFALREMEKSGKDWTAAIRDLAGRIHSYFTTPLGMVLRRDLFGNRAVFLSPDAKIWMKKTAG